MDARCRARPTHDTLTMQWMQLGVRGLIPWRVVKNVLCCLPHTITGGGASRRLEWGIWARTLWLSSGQYPLTWIDLLRVIPKCKSIHPAWYLHIERVYHSQLPSCRKDISCTAQGKFKQCEVRISERWKDLPSMAGSFGDELRSSHLCAGKIFPLMCWEANLVNTQLDAKIPWTKLLIVCKIL